jgi:O-antigen ligase
MYGLVIVVFYSLYRHITYGIFDEKIAHWASNPFYKDHTSYGALLAFYTPPAIALISINGNTKKEKLFRIIILSILITGLIFSYSRAAWVSLLGVLFIWIIIKFKIKARFIVLFVTIIGITITIFSSNLIQDLKLNKQDSSTKNISDHIKSISNISTDASNLERLNRWNCAIRMFKEKPLFGWGPGTYSFQYAPFQIASEKTIISTNNGDMGNAHSEYLGPLSEQGLLGLLLFLSIIITTIITGVRVIKNITSHNIRILAIASFLGLFTYYLHGFLNNFLDTDKASAPFWGFTALLVTFDIYYRNKKDELKNEIS